MSSKEASYSRQKETSALKGRREGGEADCVNGERLRRRGGAGSAGEVMEVKVERSSGVGCVEGG
jgi:hypothetical protein